MNTIGKLFRFFLSMTLLFSSGLFLSSCKKTVTNSQNKAPQTFDSRATGPQLQAGQWLGRDDLIDPKLGELKSLD